MSAAARTDGLETGPRHAAWEDRAGLLHGQGHGTTVEVLDLTVRGGGRQVEPWAQRQSDDSFRLWLVWPDEVRISPADRLQDAAVQVNQVLRRTTTRES